MLEVSTEELDSRPTSPAPVSAARYCETQLEALGRLFTAAQDLSLEASRCALFLLGWYYPAEVGGVDLSLVGWRVSSPVATDMALVFQLMLHLQQSGAGVSQLGFDTQARSLLAIWFPEALGMPPRPATGPELKAFRQRHDLTRQACAALVRVPTSVYREWEQDRYPIPMALWIELRTLMGERRLRSTPRGAAAERVVWGRFG
ncbi:helix-turn-helix domain-containing protein [Pseudomonas vanderleydeniana]|uniref:DUF7673 domain-containing protein n=1 Tax=Pseudomonas vanderleydeniana TaxID=2745495 RepID=A0A9E6PQW0_9PSED|nr:hypothetical protein [Pseudomonas vanderleydeniana]QXI30533.1 hypothetical protein HU752_011550 [Pseudomonas vanderleydeniana]